MKTKTTPACYMQFSACLSIALFLCSVSCSGGFAFEKNGEMFSGNTL